MTKMCLIYTTVADMQQARDLARVLLKNKAIACANILPPMTAIYTWKGEPQENSEIGMILKTTQNNVAAARTCIEKHHPYEVPCIAVLPTETVNKAFLDWVQDNTC